LSKAAETADTSSPVKCVYLRFYGVGPQSKNIIYGHKAFFVVP
jgi:hypothetical protein